MSAYLMPFSLSSLSLLSLSLSSLSLSRSWASDNLEKNNLHKTRAVHPSFQNILLRSRQRHYSTRVPLTMEHGGLNKSHLFP